MKFRFYNLFLILLLNCFLPGEVFGEISHRPEATPPEESASLYQFPQSRSLISKDKDPLMYEDSRKLWEKGQVLEKAGRYAAALDEYEDLLDDYPDSPFAPEAQWRYALGLEREGKLYHAFRAFQVLLDDYPGRGELDEVLKHQFQIGEAFLTGRKRHFLFFRIRSGLPTAVEIFRQVVRNATFSDYSPQAQYNLALALQEQGKYEAAGLEYDLVRKNYPHRDVLPDTIFQLGVCSYRQSLKANYDQGKERQAVRYFSKFIRLYPQHARVEEARELMKKLLDREAEKAFRIARFYDKKSTPDGARIYYQEVVDKYPDSSLAAKSRERLKELKKNEAQ